MADVDRSPHGVALLELEQLRTDLLAWLDRVEEFVVSQGVLSANPAPGPEAEGTEGDDTEPDESDAGDDPEDFNELIEDDEAAELSAGMGASDPEGLPDADAAEAPTEPLAEDTERPVEPDAELAVPRPRSRWSLKAAILKIFEDGNDRRLCMIMDELPPMPGCDKRAVSRQLRALVEEKKLGRFGHTKATFYGLP